MEDGEVALSNRPIGGAKPTSSGSGQESTPVDSYLDDILKNTKTCTHTHTCNPPAPGSVQHTHMCYHTHTQLISSGENEKIANSSGTKKPRRPSGNREAVRRYREKKKAHAAYLEEEVKKLSLLNQHLVRKLQGRVSLEAEASRLRSLLVDVKGRIDSELGLFPSPKLCGNNISRIISFKEGESVAQSSNGVSGLHCETDAPSFDPIVAAGPSLPTGCLVGGEVSVLNWERNCQPAVAECQVSEMASGCCDCPIVASEAFVPSSKSS